MEVEKLEDIHFLAAFKFYRKDARRVTWMARAVREQAGLVVYVTLESSRTLKTGGKEHSLHFSGKVYLKPLETEIREANSESPKWNGSYTVQAEDIYQLYFHGPAFQVLEGVQRSGDTVLGKLNKKLPAIHKLRAQPGEHAHPGGVMFPDRGHLGDRQDRHHGSAAFRRKFDSLPAEYNGAAIYAEVKPVMSASGELSFRCPCGKLERPALLGIEGIPHHSPAGNGGTRPAGAFAGVDERLLTVLGRIKPPAVICGRFSENTFMSNPIYWMLIDTDQTVPEAQGVLSGSEFGKYSAFRFSKRRDEWLLGRWTAKCLAHSLPGLPAVSTGPDRDPEYARKALLISNCVDGTRPGGVPDHQPQRPYGCVRPDDN